MDSGYAAGAGFPEACGTLLVVSSEEERGLEGWLGWRLRVLGQGVPDRGQSREAGLPAGSCGQARAAATGRAVLTPTGKCMPGTEVSATGAQVSLRTCRAVSRLSQPRRHSDPRGPPGWVPEVLAQAFPASLSQ